MKHDHKRRRWSTRMAERFWRTVAEWRAKRLARRALTDMLLRENAHLLDDIGIGKAGTAYGRDMAQRGERHRFWML